MRRKISIWISSIGFLVATVGLLGVNRIHPVELDLGIIVVGACLVLIGSMVFPRPSRPNPKS